MYSLEQLQQKTFGQLKKIGWQLNVLPEDDKRCRLNWINALAGVQPPLLELLENISGVEAQALTESSDTSAASPGVEVEAQALPESSDTSVASPTAEVDRVQEPIEISAEIKAIALSLGIEPVGDCHREETWEVAIECAKYLMSVPLELIPRSQIPKLIRGNLFRFHHGQALVDRVTANCKSLQEAVDRTELALKNLRAQERNLAKSNLFWGLPSLDPIENFHYVDGFQKCIELPVEEFFGNNSPGAEVDRVQEPIECSLNGYHFQEPDGRRYVYRGHRRFYIIEATMEEAVDMNSYGEPVYPEWPEGWLSAPENFLDAESKFGRIVYRQPTQRPIAQTAETEPKVSQSAIDLQLHNGYIKQSNSGENNHGEFSGTDTESVGADEIAIGAELPSGCDCCAKLHGTSGDNQNEGLGSQKGDRLLEESRPDSGDTGRALSHQPPELVSDAILDYLRDIGHQIAPNITPQAPNITPQAPNITPQAAFNDEQLKLLERVADPEPPEPDDFPGDLPAFKTAYLAWIDNQEGTAEEEYQHVTGEEIWNQSGAGIGLTYAQVSPSLESNVGVDRAQAPNITPQAAFNDEQPPNRGDGRKSGKLAIGMQVGRKGDRQHAGTILNIYRSKRGKLRAKVQPLNKANFVYFDYDNLIEQKLLYDYQTKPGGFVETGSAFDKKRGEPLEIWTRKLPAIALAEEENWTLSELAAKPIWQVKAIAKRCCEIIPGGYPRTKRTYIRAILAEQIFQGRSDEQTPTEPAPTPILAPKPAVKPRKKLSEAIYQQLSLFDVAV